MFQRLFIRKHSAFRTAPASIDVLKAQLNLPTLTGIEAINIYDLHHCPEAHLAQAIQQVFADPITDTVIEHLPDNHACFVVEPLPGQFDQRADSAEQCLQLIDDSFACTKVRTAVAYLIKGEVDADGLARLKQYFINPIEAREKDLNQTELLDAPIPADVPDYPEFLTLDTAELADWHKAQGLAMTTADLALVQQHFQSLNRAPTETEIRVLDTYWSDHCRHTTFATELKHIQFPNGSLGEAMQADYQDFLEKRRAVYGNAADARPVTLMELATIDAKYLRKLGVLQDVEFSEEINACSVFIDVTENQESRQWLLQFKNETHNPPN